MHTDDVLAPLLADLRAEQESLDALVAPLDEAGWSTATPAPGWDVRTQVAHLTYFDEQGALAASDPAAYEAGRDALLADIASFDTAGPYREDAAEVLLARWRAARGAALAAFAALDPGARLPWYGPPMSARSFITARLMEAWAHGVDVRDGLGHPPSDTARLRHIAHLGFVTHGWSYAVRGQQAPEAPVQVVLDGPDGTTWTLGEPASDRITGPAVDFCLVVTQRRRFADTRLVAEGPAAIGWMAVAQAFAGGATLVERV